MKLSRSGTWMWRFWRKHGMDLATTSASTWLPPQIIRPLMLFGSPIQIMAGSSYSTAVATDVSKCSFQKLTSFEGLCVHLHVGGESVTLLSIYHPGSCRPSTLFFEELRMVLEIIVLQPGLIILGGDINIHVEKEDDDDSVRFSELIKSFNIIQHVVEPTHLHGGTLDLVATFSDTPLNRIIFDPAGMISDHSLVTAFMTVRHRVDPARIRQVRNWKTVDLSAFREAIRESASANPSPSLTSSNCLRPTMVVCIVSPIVSPRGTRHVPRSDRYHLGSMLTVELSDEIADGWRGATVVPREPRIKQHGQWQCARSTLTS